MTDLLMKAELLGNANYRYNFDREIYVNRGDRKVFSLEFVEDRDKDTLRQMIDEKNGAGWHFYFNSEPSPTIKQGLEQELECLIA